MGRGYSRGYILEFHQLAAIERLELFKALRNVRRSRMDVVPLGDRGAAVPKQLA